MTIYTPTYNPYGEGHSTNRPPLFNESDFVYWKARIRVYFQVIDFDLQHIMTNGPHTPTVLANGVQTPKPINDYSEDDKKLASMNAKAINIFYCALKRNEFNRMFTCTNAHDIWHLLQVTHEGTNQVKESKISMLVHSYELFKMDAN